MAYKLRLTYRLAFNSRSVFTNRPSPRLSTSSYFYSSSSPQIDEEVAKLLELKAQIKDEGGQSGPQKFQLKVPKV